MDLFQRVSVLDSLSLLCFLMFSIVFTLSLLAAGTLAHHDNEQEHFQANDALVKEQWAVKYGKQVDLTFSGPLSYAHLPYTRCLDDTTVSVRSS